MFDLETFLILVIGCSLAGFVDAAAGGGGLISIPTYMLTSIPTHFLLGTNKFTASSGAIVSAITYFKNGRITKKLMFFCVPFASIGAVLGVKTVVIMDQNFLRPIIMILVFLVGIYTLFAKNIGTKNEFDESNIKVIHYIIASLFSFIMGFYDGFFGPGTGSFLIMFFITYLKMDFIVSSGNSKAINLASNLISFIMFAIEGKIYYLIGLPIIPFVMFFTWLGAKLAIKKGVKIIKPIFVTMSLLLSLKMFYDTIINI